MKTFLFILLPFVSFAQNVEYANYVESKYGVPAKLTLAIHEIEKYRGIEANNCFFIHDLYGVKQEYKNELESYNHFGLVVSRSMQFEALRAAPKTDLETLIKIYYHLINKNKNDEDRKI